MKILITGSNGFVGSNLRVTLEEKGYDILTFDTDDSEETLKKHCEVCDFVVHLAGVNRSTNSNDFIKGNVSLTSQLVSYLEECGNLVPIVLSSSIHADKDNDYGSTKSDAEKILRHYNEKTQVEVYIFRFSNMYGKWSKPNYNSVIATWCHNIANNLEITVTDPSIEVPFIYIDDVVAAIISAIEGKVELSKDHYYTASPIDKVQLGVVSDLLYSFKESRINKFVPELSTPFAKKLYSTYLSYIPIDQMNYELLSHTDERGSFTEFLKSDTDGQVSINVSKPGIIKGQHWHHTKNEKFLVVSGNGVIRIRHIITMKIFEYYVCGDKLEVIDIPVGYTHNIENLGNTDMVTVMWVNEVFDPSNPDTYSKNV